MEAENGEKAFLAALKGKGVRARACVCVQKAG